MSKIYFFIFVVFFSVSHGQLVISEKIYQQMQVRENPLLLLKSQKSNIQEPYIYTVAGTKSFKSENDFKVSKLDNFYRFTLNNKIKSKIFFKSENAMRKRAMEEIKALLPQEVSDSCAITSVGYEYEKRDSADARIVGSVVMAHRLLDGFPVRGSSYVLMSYDSTGNLNYLDVHWDKYDKIYAKSTVDVKKRNEIHRQEFNELIETISKDFKEKKLRGSIDNSVQTLISLENENGEIILAPNVTFIGQYSANNSDDSIPMIFDIPTDASMVPLNKAIVSR